MLHRDDDMISFFSAVSVLPLTLAAASCQDNYIKPKA